MSARAHLVLRLAAIAAIATASMVPRGAAKVPPASAAAEANANASAALARR